MKTPPRSRFEPRQRTCTVGWGQKTSHFLSYFVVCSEELGEFVEMKGASSPGILMLTTSLSKPFMRLDKYPTLLKELERHMEVKDS